MIDEDKTVNDILKDPNIIWGHANAANWLAEHGYPLSKKSLLNMASLGTGPVFYKWGHKVIYRSKDISKWAADRWGGG